MIYRFGALTYAGKQILQTTETSDILLRFTVSISNLKPGSDGEHQTKRNAALV